MRIRDPELFAYVAAFGAVPLRLVLAQLEQPIEESKRYDHTHCIVCLRPLWADRKHVSICSRACRDRRSMDLWRKRSRSVR